jgi:hypothetical protein
VSGEDIQFGVNVVEGFANGTDKTLTVVKVEELEHVVVFEDAAA